MEKVAFAGFGEIGQSVAKLYDREKYQLFAIDPIFNNINNSNQDISTELYRVLKEVYIEKNLIELSKLHQSSVTELLRALQNSVTESKTSDSKSLIEYSHNIEYHNINILNICFGYSNRFIEFATDYIKLFNPELVVVHSTVPIGTCREIFKATGVKIVHSPVVGKHPDLAESLVTFEKALSGIDDESVEMGCNHLTELGIDVVPFSKLENSEAAKMLSTSYYAHCIDWMRDVKQFCDEQGLDFEDVYHKFNNIYNYGYHEMDVHNVQRPVLAYMEGGIGGHCLVENMILLYIDNPTFRKTLHPILLNGKKSDLKFKDKAWLFCEHIVKQRSLIDIGEECGVSGTTVGNCLKKFGYNALTSKWTKEEEEILTELSSEMTFKEISDSLLLLRSYDSIRIRASKLGLESIYDPSVRDLDTRKKISCTLRDIDEKEFDGFKNLSERKNKKYFNWRYNIYNKYKFTCQKCGQIGGKINAHHIESFSKHPEKRFDDDNGIVLCEDCHVRFHAIYGYNKQNFGKNELNAFLLEKDKEFATKNKVAMTKSQDSSEGS